MNSSDLDGGINLDSNFKEIIHDQKITQPLTLGVGIGNEEYATSISYHYGYRSKFFKKNDLKSDEVVIEGFTGGSKTPMGSSTYTVLFPKQNFIKEDKIKSFEKRLSMILRDRRNFGEWNDNDILYNEISKPYYYDIDIKHLKSYIIDDCFKQYNSLSNDLKKTFIKTLDLCSQKNKNNKIFKKFNPAQKGKSSSPLSFMKEINTKFELREKMDDYFDELFKNKKLSDKELAKKIIEYPDLTSIFDFDRGPNEVDPKDFKKKLIKIKSFLNSKNSGNIKKFTDFFVKDYIKEFNNNKQFYRSTFLDKKQGFRDDAQNYSINIVLFLLNFVFTRNKFVNLISLNNFYNTSRKRVTNTLSKLKNIQITKLPDRFNLTNSSKDYVDFNNENLVEHLAVKSTRDKINNWFKKLNIGYEIGIKEDGNYYSITYKPINKKFLLKKTNVGQGLSVFLPLIIDCLTSKNKIFICEEPEINLHPKLQADVAELIVESHLERNNQFILETHSEDFLNRILKLVKKKKLNKNSVKLHYVSRKNNKSFVKQMNVDEKGRYANSWKDDIFSEKLNEL